MVLHCFTQRRSVKPDYEAGIAIETVQTTSLRGSDNSSSGGDAAAAVAACIDGTGCAILASIREAHWLGSEVAEHVTMRHGSPYRFWATDKLRAGDA